MCAVAVLMSALAALVAIVLLARWEAWWREERARREDYSVNEWLAGAEHTDNGREHDESTEARIVEDHYHDAERGGRTYVTVGAIKTRITREAAEATRQRPVSENTSPLPRMRPSPYPRGGRRAAEH